VGRSNSLHEACFQGRLEDVKAFLDGGVDPNEPASESDGWVSSAGARPRPLNCVAVAWVVSPEHLEIARLLLERGAVVDWTVVEDLSIEMTMHGNAQRLLALFQANLVDKKRS